MTELAAPRVRCTVFGACRTAKRSRLERRVLQDLAQRRARNPFGRRGDERRADDAGGIALRELPRVRQHGHAAHRMSDQHHRAPRRHHGEHGFQVLAQLRRRCRSPVTPHRIGRVRAGRRTPSGPAGPTARPVAPAESGRRPSADRSRGRTPPSAGRPPGRPPEPLGPPRRASSRRSCDRRRVVRSPRPGTDRRW